MPGKLVVVGRPDPATFWQLLAAGVDQATAVPLAQQYLVDHPTGRVAVCQVQRSFASVAQTTEDVDAKVDP
jgi:hypothetical protein